METVQSLESKFDLELWPLDPKINRSPLQVVINTFEVSLLYVKWKWSYCAETVKNLMSEFDLYHWPLDPKINRGDRPSSIIANKCVKYHHCMPKGNGVIVQKLLKSLKSKYDLDLLTLEFFLGSWSTHLWSIIIVGQKKKVLLGKNHFFTDRQTDARTVMVKPVYPLQQFSFCPDTDLMWLCLWLVWM